MSEALDNQEEKIKNLAFGNLTDEQKYKISSLEDLVAQQKREL